MGDDAKQPRLDARSARWARKWDGAAGGGVAYRAALEEWPREQEPLNWATIQNNLARVLETLGGREEGTARLEEALVAYRAALRSRP